MTGPTPGIQNPKFSLHPAIAALLGGIRTGDPKIHNGLGLWPVFAER